MAKAVEELAELIVEVQKVHFDKGNWVDLAEEIADAQIMCEQLSYIFSLESMVAEWENIKLERMEEMLKS
jgi:hypothetical protein